MALPEEPKNGDFASYIEALSRGGAQAPGRVMDKAARTARGLATGWGRGTDRGKAGADGAPGAVAPRWPSPAAEPALLPQGAPALPGASPLPDAPSGPPLAARTAQRRVGLGLTLLSLIVAWIALGRLAEALSHQPFEFERLFPGIFLGAFAFMLYQAARQSRRKAARNPLPRYAPLDSLSGKMRGKNGKP